MHITDGMNLLQVYLEVYNELPEHITLDDTLSSTFRIIFRGRQLLTPSLTLGALHVKNGERFMILPRRNLHQPSVSLDV